MQYLRLVKAITFVFTIATALAATSSVHFVICNFVISYIVICEFQVTISTCESIQRNAYL